MLDAVRLKIDDIFKKYPDINFISSVENENDIAISFSYKSIKFLLEINNYNEIFLRIVKAYAFPEINDVAIPPHFLQKDEAKKMYSLCLLDKERHVLTSYDLFELVDLYLYQIKRLLDMTSKQIEREFQKEFLYYWNLSAKKGFIDIYIGEESEPAELELWCERINKIDKFTTLPKNVSLNELHKPKGTYETAIYIPISDISGILPPNNNFTWTDKELLNILCNQVSDKISSSTYEFLKNIKISSYRKLIIFSFNLKDSITICFAALITFNTNQKGSLISKIQDDFHSVQAIWSNRMDLSFLQSRVGMRKNLNLPSVLVLGVGSVGSYIVPELINLGITNIGLSDPDAFNSGNAFRHYLGPAYTGSNKADAMRSVVEKANPLVKVSVISNILCMNSDELEKTIASYDVILVAVGTSDIQREMNMKFSKLNIEKHFIFNWLDSAGKGSHLLYTNYKSKGCFNCLFYDEGQKRDNNKTSFADGTEVLIGNGCCGTFSPYGNTVLLRNTLMVVSVIKDIIDKKISKATLVSMRNNFDSLEKSISIEPIINNDFYDEGCDICGLL